MLKAWPRYLVSSFCFCIIFIHVEAQHAQLDKLKQSAIKTIEQHQDALIKLSVSIWEFAETALAEDKSCTLLEDYAERNGFRVTRSVAGLPTAFTAEYGSGRPIIGILGEYDALPGISQKALAHKEALVAGGAGHGCGHNLFGPGSLGAAIAIKELIKEGKLSGTIRFYGTPAEESVGGKVYMVRSGLFSDLDICLDWHPGTEILANTQSTTALIEFMVEFKGKAAHASFDPWNGKSALDGLEAFTHGVNLLREHIRPSSRMHYVILSGGEVPNVVPEYAKVWMWVRGATRADAEETLNRIRSISKGAGMIAGVESSLTVLSGNYELMVNEAGAKTLDRNLRTLGPIVFSSEEIDFAKKLQEAQGVEQIGLDSEVHPLIALHSSPKDGSTDVGDVSWVVPQITLITTTAPKGIAWHGWGVVAASGMSIGHKGMIYSAKALAMTMIDLFQSEALRRQIWDEYRLRRGDQPYVPYIQEGPPPGLKAESKHN